MLLAALSTVSFPPMRYSPPAPYYWVPPGGSSICLTLPLSLSSAAIVSVAPIYPLDAPALPCFYPPMSLGLSLAPLRPPPPSLGLFRPPAPPARLLPRPWPPISRKDEYVGDRTGRGEACWKTAGGSAPRRKCPSRPLAMVGDGISRPLLLHQPQSSTPCTVGWCYRTCTSCQTGPRSG